MTLVGIALCALGLSANSGGFVLAAQKPDVEHVIRLEPSATEDHGVFAMRPEEGWFKVDIKAQCDDGTPLEGQEFVLQKFEGEPEMGATKLPPKLSELRARKIDEGDLRQLRTGPEGKTTLAKLPGGFYSLQISGQPCSDQPSALVWEVRWAPVAVRAVVSGNE